MRKLFYCFVVIVMAGAAWGCVALDLDGEPVEAASQVSGEAASQVSGEAQQPAGELSEVEPDAYYSCEDKRCGEPCAPGGYVCNIFGECTKQNPACD